MSAGRRRRQRRWPRTARRWRGSAGGPALGAARPRTVGVDQPPRAEARVWISPSRPSSAHPCPARAGPRRPVAACVAAARATRASPEIASGRLGRHRRRVQQVQVPGCRAAQLIGPPHNPADPAAHGVRRHAQPLPDQAGAGSGQPLGQRDRDDLDPVPTAGYTPGRQEHMGAPAVGAAGAPRGQPHPSAVEQCHHPRPGVGPRCKPPRRQDGHASRRAARSASARSGSRYSSTPTTAFRSCPARWSGSSGRGRGSSCCTLAKE